MDIIKILGSNTVYQMLLTVIAKEYVKKGVDAAERAFTLPERDVKKLCKQIGVTDADQVTKAVEAARGIGKAIANFIGVLANVEAATANA